MTCASALIHTNMYICTHKRLLCLRQLVEAMGPDNCVSLNHRALYLTCPDISTESQPWESKSFQFTMAYWSAYRALGINKRNSTRAPQVTVSSAFPPILLWIKVTITIIGPATQLSINPSAKHIYYITCYSSELLHNQGYFLWYKISSLAVYRLFTLLSCLECCDCSTAQIHLVFLLSEYVKLSKSIGSVCLQVFGFSHSQLKDNSDI